jgi:hypothetical protein
MRDAGYECEMRPALNVPNVKSGRPVSLSLLIIAPPNQLCLLSSQYGQRPPRTAYLFAPPFNARTRFGLVCLFPHMEVTVSRSCFDVRAGSEGKERFRRPLSLSQGCISIWHRYVLPTFLPHHSRVRDLVLEDLAETWSQTVSA